MSRGYILVVDDEVSILQSLRRALGLEGYSIDVAGGFALAQEKLEKNAYDLLLLDVALPDGDGVRLLSNLRAAGNDENIFLTPPIRHSLEQAMEFIDSDELVEITPNSIRLRKRFLTEAERKRADRGPRQ